MLLSIPLFPPFSFSSYFLAELFTINTSIHIASSCGHYILKTCWHTFLPFEMDSILRSPGTLLLIVFPA